MEITSQAITIKAYGPANLFDLTTGVRQAISDAPVANGRLFIFSVGSTGAVIGLPDDREAQTAFVEWVRRAIPFDQDHRHPGNAYAHLRSTLIKSHLSLPVTGRRLPAIRPFLLENTAGRKSRPIMTTFLGQGGDMSFYRAEFEVEGQGWIDIVDITGRVMDIAAASGRAVGQVFVSAVDARSAVITIENDMRLLLDTADFIDSLVRRGGRIDRATAGHVAAAALGPSVGLPLARGRLETGAWQQIMAVDLAEGGPKRIIVDVIGE